MVAWRSYLSLTMLMGLTLCASIKEIWGYRAWRSGGLSWVPFLGPSTRYLGPVSPARTSNRCQQGMEPTSMSFYIRHAVVLLSPARQFHGLSTCLAAVVCKLSVKSSPTKIKLFMYIWGFVVLVYVISGFLLRALRLINRLVLPEGHPIRPLRRRKDAEKGG